ncbi:hypothetical protein CYCD_04140 [Tenuifilaceae bacterium CYCD]|nr:hypothetical protein CYCD_04140 [Tenuifilaceae bacterium CYCD]
MSKAKLYTSNLIDELFQETSPEELEKTEKRMLLAAQIEDAMKRKGWKAKDLAKAIGKSPSEISKWLSGTHNFTSDTLFDLEKVLDTCIFSREKSEDTVIINNWTLSISSSATDTSYEDSYYNNYKEIFNTKFTQSTNAIN